LKGKLNLQNSPVKREFAKMLPNRAQFDNFNLVGHTVDSGEKKKFMGRNL